MACYRTTAPNQQRDLTTTAARLADDAGFPLLIDVRPGLVILDSGKDRWDAAVLVFQPLDASDTERCRQRNRIHLELAVPADVAPTRLAAVVAAGGQLLAEAADRWHLADPEGNELVVTGG